MDSRIHTIGEAIATIGELGKNIREPGSPLDENDTFLIPYLKIFNQTDFAPLLNVRSSHDPTRQFNAALQQIRLELNPEGVDLETKAFLVPPGFLGSNSANPVGKDQARNLVFNQPFFLMLWREGGSHPYLAGSISKGGIQEAVDR